MGGGLQRVREQILREKGGDEKKEKTWTEEER